MGAFTKVQLILAISLNLLNIFVQFNNNATKRACEHEHEPMSENGYFWNIFMMRT
jgi:hypothetical protein